MSERRLKVVYFEKGLLLDMLNDLSRFDYVSLPVTEEIPDGTEVVDVQYFFERDAFCLKLYHPSFAEVEPCSMIPEARGTLDRIGLRKRNLLETHV